MAQNSYSISNLLTGLISSDTQAGMFNTQGRSAYAQALGQANTLSSRANAANRQAQRDTGAALRNMVTMRSNQVRDMAAAHNHAANTGIVNSGRLAGKVATAYGKAVDDASRSAAANDANLRAQAYTLNNQAASTLRLGAAQQHYYSSMAKATRTGAWLNATSTLLGMGASGWASYNSAKAYNAANQKNFDAYNQKYAAEIKAGTMQPMTGVSTGGAFLAGGLSGVNVFTGLGGGQDSLLSYMGMSEEQRRQLAGYGR